MSIHLIPCLELIFSIGWPADTHNIWWYPAHQCREISDRGNRIMAMDNLRKHHCSRFFSRFIIDVKTEMHGETFMDKAMDKATAGASLSSPNWSLRLAPWLHPCACTWRMAHRSKKLRLPTGWLPCFTISTNPWLVGGETTPMKKICQPTNLLLIPGKWKMFKTTNQLSYVFETIDDRHCWKKATQRKGRLIHPKPGRFLKHQMVIPRQGWPWYALVISLVHSADQILHWLISSDWMETHSSEAQNLIHQIALNHHPSSIQHTRSHHVHNNSHQNVLHHVWGLVFCLVFRRLPMANQSFASLGWSWHHPYR